MTNLTFRQLDILEYLEANPLSTTREIASALQVAPDRIEGTLITLHNHGLVGRQNALGLDDSLHRMNGEPWRWKSARTVAEVGS